MTQFLLPLADAGPGPLFGTVLGSALIAGLFLFLAVVSGGFWLLTRTDSLAVVSWRKRSLVFAGVAVISSSLFLGFMAFAVADAWPVGIVAGVLLVIVGVWMIRQGIIPGGRALPKSDEPQ